MDDFSTGTRANLADVGENVGAAAWARFEFSEADIRDSDACRRACEGTAFVLHQAALGSVHGAYAIQGFASVFIPRIEGNYPNVMGLPLPLTYDLLTHHGFTCRTSL